VGGKKPGKITLHPKNPGKLTRVPGTRNIPLKVLGPPKDVPVGNQYLSWNPLKKVKFPMCLQSVSQEKPIPPGESLGKPGKERS